MVWFRIDDSFYDHPKVKRIPRAARKGAIMLWSLEGSYCGKALTEGLVMAEDIADRGATRKDADALVATGLWHPPGYECTSEHCVPVIPEGHYQYHDWLQWNPSKEKVLAERAATAERQRRARERSKSRRDDAGSNEGSNAVTNSVSNGERAALVTVPPTRPDPTPSSTYVDLEGGRSVPREEAHPATRPSGKCPKHPRGTDEPCGGCRAAKADLANWEADEHRRQSLAASEAARERARLVRAAIDHCELCDDEGYRKTPDGTRGPHCDHIDRQPGALARARAAVAQPETRTA